MLVRDLPNVTPDDAAVNVSECVDAAEWNAWLKARGGNTLFHRAEWDSVFGVYRLQIVRLCALRDNAIIGGLSLVWQKSRLFGNQLVSLPWFDAAGIIADDHAAIAALLERALTLADARRVESIQLRQFEPLDGASSAGATLRTDKVLVRLLLPNDPVELWNRFSPKVRNQVRKGEKSGLTVESGGPELLRDFHAIYTRNMRDLGSPPHHRRFFEAVLDAFAGESRVWIVRLKRQAVGAALTLANSSVLEIPWASSWRRYNDLCVNHVMYWKILEFACRGGFRTFHFGRSSLDSGTYQFKKQWGAEPVPLYWQFLARGSKSTEHLTSPQKSFNLASRAWSRLPVWLVRALGPHIISKTP